MTLKFAAALGAALLMASTASAAVVDYEFNGSLANSGDGASTITNNGATLGATGLSFDANEGPTLSGLGVLTEYTLETRFALDSVTGYRKVADFLNRASDTGFYVLNGGLAFYSFASGPGGQFSGDSFITAKVVREGSNQVTGYLNGVQQFTFADTGGNAVITNTLHLFRDDLSTGQAESSGGFMDWVRLSSDQLATSAAPEPGAWALMILGFGLLGAAARRRVLAG